jgi:hypothetical protein
MANLLSRDTIAAHDFRPDYGIVQKALVAVTAYNTAKAADLTIGVLPNGATIISIQIIVVTASNAVTTGTLSVGKTGTNTQYVNGQDVKGTSGIVIPTVANAGVALTADTTIVARYADTGGAATAGSFTVVIEYTVPA